MKNIAIFASGKGSNAEKIMDYFKSHPSIKVNLVVTNNPGAGVIHLAHQRHIMSAIISKNFLNNEEQMLRLLQAQQIDLIVLAGFLQLVPSFILNNFPDRVINIHPSLLPKHGGPGMYGNKVHQAVIDSGDTETGITIHFANEHYDDGKIIFQKKIAVNSDINIDLLSKAVLGLEHEHYPQVIEQVLSSSVPA